MKTNKKIEEFYSKYSKNIKWKRKPKKIIKINNKDNRYEWFNDGILSSYENLISLNLQENLKNKTALITVSKDKDIKKYSYEDINEKVNNLIDYFFKNNKKKILKL